MAGLSKAKHQIVYIVSPDGEAGGGMGRVKDYILGAGFDGSSNVIFKSLITRDMRGAKFSIVLTLRAIWKIFIGAAFGRLALVHVNMGDRGSAVRKGIITLWCRLLGVDVIVHLHAVEMDRHFAQGNAFRRCIMRIPFRCADSIIVLGQRFRNWLVLELNIDPDKIDVLYNGVYAESAPAPRDFAKTPQTILFLGSLIERKGVSDLIAALAALPRDTAPWRLVAVGEGDQRGYTDQARAAGIADRIAFTGWVDRARTLTLLRDADFLVLPSYEEGLPLVILEALGAALPVICTPVGAIGEVLEHGSSALFCQPGRPDELSDRIAQMLADRDLRVRLSRQGRELFDQRFSLHAFMAGLAAIYWDRFGLGANPNLDQPEP